MQYRKTYSGSMPAGSRVSRQYNWGNSGTASMYTDWVDFLNTTIAAFLTECGVSAAYTQKSGDSDKWLYIYGVPFFVGYTSGASYVYQTYLYEPLGNGTADSSYLHINASISGTTITYSFSLDFSGKAASGFYLRAGFINTSSVYTIDSQGAAFFPCVSAANSASAAAWMFHPGSYWMANVMELSGSAPVTSGYDATLFHIACGLPTKNVMSGDNKFPLVPVFFGKYRASGLYLLPLNYGVPTAAAYNTENMTEFTVGGRTFLNLCRDALVSSATTALALGILDVT